MPLWMEDMPKVCSLSRPALIYLIFFFYFFDTFDKHAEITD